MIVWKDLELKCEPEIDEALRQSSIILSDYTCTNLWMWNELRHYQWTKIDNDICIKFKQKDHEIYLFPIGGGSHIDTISKLYEKNHKFVMRAIPEDQIPELKKLKFTYTVEVENDRSDYIYLYQDLLHLVGNKFQAKRNLIYQFERKYDYNFFEISPVLIPYLIDMLDIWFKEHQDKGHHIEQEYIAVKRALENYFNLPLKGGALIVDEKVVGFSFAEMVNPSMWLIHAEKAHLDYKGSYQMLNNQLMHLLTPTQYVNKEESLGIPGLTQSKNSYHPVKILKKYCLRSSATQ